MDSPSPEAPATCVRRQHVLELEQQIQDRLQGRLRNFRLILRDEGLVLVGSASTYHAKQLAQHAVMDATDLPIYANIIQVV